MKSKIIALLTVLSINGIYSLHGMGRGNDGSVNAWRTSDVIAHDNLGPRITHTEPSPSNVAAESEQERLLRIRQEEATVRANSFEIIGEEGLEGHTNDDLLAVSPKPLSGKSSPEMNDSALDMASHVASPGARDFDISPTEREALVDEGLPQKNFAEDRAWIEREANEALDKGAVERKATEEKAKILQEKKVAQEKALQKLTDIKAKTERLFQKMKTEIARQIEDIEENDEMSKDEEARKTNLAKLLEKVTSGEIAQMKEISELKLKLTTRDLSSKLSELERFFNSSLEPISKKKLFFSVGTEGEKPNPDWGKLPTTSNWIIEEKGTDHVILWKASQLIMPGQRR